MLIEENDFPESVTLSYSRSTLQKISLNIISSKQDYWTLKTRQKILVGWDRGRQIIKMAWIPRHSSIKGNDQADALSKEGISNLLRKGWKVHSILSLLWWRHMFVIAENSWGAFKGH